MIVFTASCTGGHLYPGIAMAQRINDDICFLTGEGSMGSELLSKYGFQYRIITGKQSRKKGIIISFFRSWVCLRQLKPKVLIAMGGYLTFPVVLAAFLLRIPIVLHEQNVLPGRVNRICQLMAKKIWVSFEESANYFVTKKVKLTGNPIRKHFYEDEIYRRFRHEALPKYPVILVVGGSQGASFINEKIKEQYPFFLDSPYCLLHVTGIKDYPFDVKSSPYHQIQNDVKEKKIFVFPYFEKMDFLYQLSAFVISRSGATTITELLFFRKPSFLIPYPYATDQHQLINARLLQKKGLSQFSEQKSVNLSTLFHGLDQLIAEQTKQLEQYQPIDERCLEKALAFI